MHRPQILPYAVTATLPSVAAVVRRVPRRRPLPVGAARSLAVDRDGGTAVPPLLCFNPRIGSRTDPLRQVKQSRGGRGEAKEAWEKQWWEPATFDGSHHSVR
ncbi:hypothetical protein Van01_25550 [Micromonospora andamanensis]|uniref:Secreted protein n=1 Tax=Micromonospora andamanensis TaxID=1287068 RepID=A0ABQ4HUM5_9ACTN|nr:hypothetical protein Van01_25550 [Micromonospora andamanensis]